MGELVFPLHITHVTRQWRALAIDTPHLWTTIQITRRSSIDAVRETISRSGTCELDVNFLFLPRREDSPTRRLRELTHIRDAVSLLLPHSSRFRTLCVNANTDAVQLILQLFVLVPLPRLCSLDLVQNDRAPVRHYGPFLVDPLIFSTLRLHRVTIHAGGSTHFSGLHTLVMVETPLHLINQAALDMLSHTTSPAHPPTILNLRQLSITTDLPAFPAHPTFYPSSLVSLALSGFSPSSPALDAQFTQFFNMISGENLRHLELDRILGSAWDAFLNSLQSTATPKYAGLQTLSIKSLQLRNFDFYFARAFPAITALSLVKVDPGPLLDYLRQKEPSVWRDVTISVDGSEIPKDKHVR